MVGAMRVKINRGGRPPAVSLLRCDNMSDRMPGVARAGVAVEGRGDGTLAAGALFARCRCRARLRVRTGRSYDR